MPQANTYPIHFYQSFVNSPTDLIGMVAFGIYHGVELDFIAKNAVEPAQNEAMEDAIETFRQVALVQIEGNYREQAEKMLRSYKPGNRQGQLDGMGRKFALIKNLVENTEILEAIGLFKQLFLEIDDLENLRTLRVVESNYRLARKKEVKGIASPAETRRAHARAADGILKLLEDIESGS